MILKHGIVRTGEYIGWELQVIDDTDGETGGFYLVLQNDVEVFDYWFEKQEFLENQLDDFEVNWKS